MKARVLSSSRKIVNTVTKLVEESHNFIVLKEGRLIFRGFGEIAN